MKITAKLPDGTVLNFASTRKHIVIGRSSKSDFIVDDKSVSRKHCQVEQISDSFFVTDLASGNGTKINNVRIKPKTKESFNTFFPLQIGNVECHIFDYNEEDQQEDILKNTNSKLNINKKKRMTTTSHSRGLTNEQKFKFISFLVLSFVAASAYFVISKDKAKELKSQTPVKDETIKANVPDALKGIIPEFKTQAQYLSFQNQALCESEAPSCKHMSITTSLDEGIFVDKGEAYVFNFISNKIDHKVHEKILNHPQIDEIISLKSLLGSPLYKRFKSKEIVQVHLVLFERNPRTIKKVIRFHAMNFAKNGNEGEALLIDLFMLIKLGEDQTFKKNSAPLIKVKTF